MSGLFSLPDELLLTIIKFLPYDVALRHVCKYLRKLSKPHIIYKLNTCFSIQFLDDMMFQGYIDTIVPLSNISLTFRNHTFCVGQKYILDDQIHSIAMIGCNGIIGKNITDKIIKIYIDSHIGPLYFLDIKNISEKIIYNTPEIIEENSIDTLDVSIIEENEEDNHILLF
jgi:hypothetical protein